VVQITDSKSALEEFAMIPVPPLTPYLVVSDAAAAIEFYKNAFGATVDMEPNLMPGTDKIMHVRLLINGSMIMMADDFSAMMGGACMTPPALGGSPITLALQLEDVQSFWDRAVAGGAIVTMPLADQFWGDRYGQLKDPFGHKWSMAQNKVSLTKSEIEEAAKTSFKM
jgi:PhnB protein